MAPGMLWVCNLTLAQRNKSMSIKIYCFHMWI